MLEGHGRRQSASRTPDRSPPRTPSVSLPPIQSWPDSAGVIAAAPHAFSGAGPAVAAATLNSGSAGSGGHTCPYCNKTFVSQSKVKRHFLVRSRHYPRLWPSLRELRFSAACHMCARHGAPTAWGWQLVLIDKVSHPMCVPICRCTQRTNHSTAIRAGHVSRRSPL